MRDEKRCTSSWTDPTRKFYFGGPEILRPTQAEPPVNHTHSCTLPRDGHELHACACGSSLFVREG